MVSWIINLESLGPLVLNATLIKNKQWFGLFGQMQ